MENNDGLVVLNSNPIIYSNNIHHNVSNGVVALEKTYLYLIENTIKENEGIGIYLKG